MSAEPAAYRLYVTGRGPRSEAAVASVRARCAAAGEDVELEIVDVAEAPETARRDGILLTPVLVRLRPAPVRRWVGDLADLEALRLRMGAHD